MTENDSHLASRLLEAAVFALHQIDLASPELLPTTSLRLADGEHFVAVNRSRGEDRVPRRVRMLMPGIAINGNTATRRTPVSPVRSLI